MNIEKNNEIHAYWQCPNCGYVNKDIANNLQLDFKKTECSKCKTKYKLVKYITQILYKPINIPIYTSN